MKEKRRKKIKKYIFKRGFRPNEVIPRPRDRDVGENEWWTKGQRRGHAAVRSLIITTRYSLAFVSIFVFVCHLVCLFVFVFVFIFDSTPSLSHLSATMII